MLSIRQGMWVGIWHNYLGRSAIGDVIDSRASNQLSAPGSHLYIVDPDSGEIVLRERIARYFLPPVLSPTEPYLYLVNWSGRSVDMLDLATGEQATIAERIPATIINVLVDPTDHQNLILSGVNKWVYKLEIASGEVSEILETPDVPAIFAVTRDGKLLTSAFRSRELVVSNLETGQIEGVVPLQSHLDSILVDKSGPFIFGATLRWPSNVITVQVIDANSLTCWKFWIYPARRRRGEARPRGTARLRPRVRQVGRERLAQPPRRPSVPPDTTGPTTPRSPLPRTIRYPTGSRHSRSYTPRTP